jgi:O-antigen/teichoic acid export membrane protein
MLKSIRLDKKQIRNFAIYASTDGLSKALPFLVLPFITGALGSTNFGIVVNFSVLTELLTAILGMRLVFYYCADFHQVDEQGRNHLLDNISKFYVIGTVLLSLLTLACSGLIEKYLQLPLGWQQLSLLTVFLLMVGQLYTTHLRMDEKARAFGKVQTIRSVISAGGSLFFVLVLGMSWQGRVGALFTSALYLGILAFLFMRNRFEFDAKVDWRLQRKLFLFGIPMLPYAISPWFKTGLEKVFIANQVSLSASGVYALAGTLGGVFELFTGAFFNTYSPLMFKILSEEKTTGDMSGRVKLARQSILFCLAMVGVLLLGYLALYLMILFFYSKEYHGAITFLPFVLTSVFCSAMTNLFRSIIIFEKRTVVMGAVGVLMTFMQVPLTYFLVRYHGAIGAAFAGVAGSVVITVIYFFLSEHYMPLKWRQAMAGLLNHNSRLQA